MRAEKSPARTRVFRAGNSQAVRIPKVFELPEGEVYIERREGGLFISPRRGRWDLFFAGPHVEFPYSVELLRHQGEHRAVDLSHSSPIRSTRTPQGVRKRASRGARGSR